MNFFELIHCPKPIIDFNFCFSISPSQNDETISVARSEYFKFFNLFKSSELYFLIFSGINNPPSGARPLKKTSLKLNFFFLFLHQTVFLIF